MKHRVVKISMTNGDILFEVEYCIMKQSPWWSNKPAVEEWWDYDDIEPFKSLESAKTWLKYQKECKWAKNEVVFETEI